VSPEATHPYAVTVELPEVLKKLQSVGGTKTHPHPVTVELPEVLKKLQSVGGTKTHTDDGVVVENVL
jgi:hypothetical protein